MKGVKFDGIILRGNEYFEYPYDPAGNLRVRK
jgi:hypothetical protein